MMRLKQNSTRAQQQFLMLRTAFTLALLICIALVGSEALSTTLDFVVSNRNDGHSPKTFIFPPNYDNDASGDDFSSEVARNSYEGSTSLHLSRSNGRPILFHDRLVRFRRNIVSTFVPSHSNFLSAKKGNDFIRFSIYSALQDLSTSLRSVLATQRVLEGIGVGREGATALSASLNFIVRDGVGMITSLLFNSLASSKFRSDIKRWRLFADIIVDIGITLEVAATLVPPAFFLPMICIGNICKAMCGVAAGACGGAIDLYWATGTSDISEINAKFAAQRTVTGGLGLLFGAIFARSIMNAQQHVVWSVYFLLTFLHIYANVQCMRLIKFNYLNKERMDILLSNFIRQYSFQEDSVDPNLVSHPVDSPDVVSRVEPLLFIPLKPSPSDSAHRPFIKMGVSFNDFVLYSCHHPKESMTSMRHSFTCKKSHLVSPGFCKRTDRFCVLVLLFEGADSKDMTRAYFQANIYSNIMAKNSLMRKSKLSDEEQNSKLKLVEEEASHSHMDECWAAFEKQATAVGWDLTKSDLVSEGYLVQFNPRDNNSLCEVPLSNFSAQ